MIYLDPFEIFYPLEITFNTLSKGRIIYFTWNIWSSNSKSTIDTFLSLYNTIMQPHLEYGNVIWGSFMYYITIGSRMYKEQPLDWFYPQHLPYEQRLEKLALPSLRWQREDMICVYSLLNNIYDLDCSLFYSSWCFFNQGSYI